MAAKAKSAGSDDNVRMNTRSLRSKVSGDDERPTARRTATRRGA